MFHRIHPFVVAVFLIKFKKFFKVSGHFHPVLVSGLVLVWITLLLVVIQHCSSYRVYFVVFVQVKIVHLCDFSDSSFIVVQGLLGPDEGDVPPPVLPLRTIVRRDVRCYHLGMVFFEFFEVFNSGFVGVPLCFQFQHTLLPFMANDAG